MLELSKIKDVNHAQCNVWKCFGNLFAYATFRQQWAPAISGVAMSSGSGVVVEMRSWLKRLCQWFLICDAICRLFLSLLHIEILTLTHPALMYSTCLKGFGCSDYCGGSKGPTVLCRWCWTTRGFLNTMSGRHCFCRRECGRMCHDAGAVWFANTYIYIILTYLPTISWNAGGGSRHWHFHSVRGIKEFFPMW